MAKVKLTVPKVDGFTCPAEKPQAFLWDSDVPGLALRATKNGAKAFIFQSRFMGKPLRMTIGDPSIWPLNNRMDRVGPGGQVLQAGAREEARRLQAVIDAGRETRRHGGRRSRRRRESAHRMRPMASEIEKQEVLNGT